MQMNGDDHGGANAPGFFSLVRRGMPWFIFLIILLANFVRFYVTEVQPIRAKQQKFPVDFQDIQVGMPYQVLAIAYHVYLKININESDFFTIGIGTIDDCDGVYLTVPDINTIRNPYIPPIPGKIKGIMNQKQVDYLKQCMIQEVAECHPDGYFDDKLEEKFHLHRVKDAAGDFCAYRMLTPKTATDENLKPKINCGTWVTHFIQKGEKGPIAELPKFIATFFEHSEQYAESLKNFGVDVKWLKKHVKYMVPAALQQKRKAKKKNKN